MNFSIKPLSDLAQHGVDEFWSAPLETLSAEAGDCEDYALLKYFALHKAQESPSMTCAFCLVTTSDA